VLHARRHGGRFAVKAFTLLLHDATRAERVPGVTSFVGEDESGSFGILAGHAPMMTLLVMGLARYRVGEQPWQYLALPGALLSFKEDVLTISTRRYLVDRDYARISRALRDQLLAEEQALQGTKHSLHQMEKEVLKRLWGLGRAETR
jgi:F-type H+-transporting ATPase subunit epsilon